MKQSRPRAVPHSVAARPFTEKHLHPHRIGEKHFAESHEPKPPAIGFLYEDLAPSLKVPRAVFGQYPKILIPAMMPWLQCERHEVLHVCSGSLRPGEGIRVDVRPDAHPDILADGRALPLVDNSIAGVMLDPPYNPHYAQDLYGVEYPRPSHLLREAARVVRHGGRIVFVHYITPNAPPPLPVHQGLRTQHWLRIPDAGGQRLREGAAGARRMSLAIVPLTVKAARWWIAGVHRHLPGVQGGLFACAVVEGDRVLGVGLAGNPPRLWQGTGRLVITRIATGGAPNACSKLYGALCRAAAALGYTEVWTYTLPEEPGTSLRAAGFVEKGLTRGGEHDRPSRRRAPAVRPDRKRRWFRQLGRAA